MKGTIPRRRILQQEEAVEDEVALVNRRTLNLGMMTYRSKKRKAETSPSMKASAAALQHQSTKGNK